MIYSRTKICLITKVLDYVTFKYYKKQMYKLVFLPKNTTFFVPM